MDSPLAKLLTTSYEDNAILMRYKGRNKKYNSDELDFKANETEEEEEDEEIEEGEIITPKRERDDRKTPCQNFTIKKKKTNFNREFKTIEGKKVSGTSTTDDIPEPSVGFCDDMYFIKDQLEIAQTETSEQPIPDEDSQSQPNLESVGPPSDVVTPPTPKRAISAQPSTGKKWKGGPDSTDQLVGLATEYFKRPETEEDILAKGWAMKLKKLTPDQRRFAEKMINDTIFEAEMGTLTAVRFETNPNSVLLLYTSCPSESSPYQAQHHGTSREDNAATFFSSFTAM